MQRPLNNNILVTGFVKDILEIRDQEEFRMAVLAICKAERLIGDIFDPDGMDLGTYRSSHFRDPYYRDNLIRKSLRDQIFRELVTNRRPGSDEDIALEKGGALPHTEIKRERQAYIITGLPASGKSGIANLIADKKGAVIVDCDYALRKFPEYQNHDDAASLLHEEALVVTFGDEDNDRSVLNFCVANDCNIVVPKIGNNAEAILRIASMLRDSYGYDIHLTHVSLDRKKATQRAYSRFAETNRYVPLALIFDLFSDDPLITYFRIRLKEVFSSYGEISSDVKKGEMPAFMEGSEGNPARLFIGSKGVTI